MSVLQDMFNQPSQKYANNVIDSDEQPSSSSASSTATLQPNHDSPSSTIAYASEKLIALMDSPFALSIRRSSDADDADDMFFTPLTSPAVTPKNPPSPSAPVPSLSPSSVTDEDDDDLFSSPSTSTSITSLSATSKDSSDGHRKPRRRSATISNVSDWSRGVRWLVPPDSHKSRSQPSTASIIRSLDLVDVDYQSHPSRSRAIPRRSGERMSAVMEEEEDDEQPLSRAPPSSSRRPRPTSTLSRHTPRTVTLPSPLPVSAGTSSSTGYTSLTLPRAAYTPTKHRISRSVDITRGGIAQTTMATIAITNRPRPTVPAHLRTNLPSPLAFTSHTPPPAKVSAREVLVKVWAVAVDSLDALIVGERAARNDGLGFVPGRSFVGRAIETGWEVSNVSRGDWVIGITDVRKCGALAEFIVVDRRKLHRAPPPSSTPHLTLNQLALLPLLGVPAHRAVRTFAHLPRDPPSRTLILHAHDGPGLLATQELTALGVRVVAHVSGKWGDPAERRTRAAGARDVRCDEDMFDLVRDIPPAEFDGVLDTALGGKEIWAACRRILRPAGQFTTLVGDAGGGGRGLGVNAHFKSTMRSLLAQRVGYQWVSPVADVDHEGADVRDSLAAVVRLAAEGVYKPYVGVVVPFERAIDAFDGRGAGKSTVIRIVE